MKCNRGLFITGKRITTHQYVPDDRPCLVEGCRTKHCLRLVEGERIYSEFCSAHTCRHFWPDFCTCPTYSGDKYCSCHARR